MLEFLSSLRVLYRTVLQPTTTTRRSIDLQYAHDMIHVCMYVCMYECVQTYVCMYSTLYLSLVFTLVFVSFFISFYIFYIIPSIFYMPSVLLMLF